MAETITMAQIAPVLDEALRDERRVYEHPDTWAYGYKHGVTDMIAALRRAGVGEARLFAACVDLGLSEEAMKRLRLVVLP